MNDIFQVMVDYEFDVLDMHFHFVKWINLRKADGIHWNPKAHRKMSNLIFDHLADAFGFPIPRIPHWGSANGEGVFMMWVNLYVFYPFIWRKGRKSLEDIFGEKGSPIKQANSQDSKQWACVHLESNLLKEEFSILRTCTKYASHADYNSLMLMDQKTLLSMLESLAYPPHALKSLKVVWCSREYKLLLQEQVACSKLHRNTNQEQIAGQCCSYFRAPHLYKIYGLRRNL